MTSRLGATYLGDGTTEFLVWAPKAERVELVTDGHRVEMERRDRGYRYALVGDVVPGTTYRFALDGRELADPASSSQPEGVHGPSAVFDAGAFGWVDDGWPGLPLEDYVIYELHAGAFTREGTLDAVVPHLDELAELGVTAIELMPVAQFPGERNWGYDGVFPYAVQDSYGGPAALQRLVNECHRRALAFVLDVVYNHIGPEGNVLAGFGPYFTDRYRTPWGEAVNFDGPGSDVVRRFFVENAMRWSSEFHVDALRLDAVHGIVDASAHPFLEELAEAANRQPREFLMIAESDQNDRRLVTPRDAGGFGLHAQWSDDFHHSLHALLTGERQGYYLDFGSLADLATAYRDGFVYSGQYSEYRGRRFGSSSATIPGERLVVFAQNHDQVGNRAAGDRLSAILSMEQLELVAGVLLMAPYVPLLFMGEEYGELAPFRYFVSHTDPELTERVRRGRREEFGAFGWGEDVPDPQDPHAFEASRLDHGLEDKEPHRSLRRLYRELIRLRRSDPALRVLSKQDMEVVTDEERGLMTVRRWAGTHEVLAVFSFAGPLAETPAPAGGWEVVLRASSFVVLARDEP